ncbi:hypothetical protein DPMN_038335 [Dreissena polymorpha]|uniref:Uncharacterized protein n=1 Tax=Dreissena polymorpha TaxID=45954 RepID=A0A9D4ME29_DREPO|nr:hypothetical protein DPMN_038335 [Dreissena polymorpha]
MWETGKAGGGEEDERGAGQAAGGDYEYEIQVRLEEEKMMREEQDKQLVEIINVGDR